MTRSIRTTWLIAGLLLGCEGSAGLDAGPGNDAAVSGDASARDGGGGDAGARMADGGPRPDTGGAIGASTLGHERDPIALDGIQLGALGMGTHMPDRIGAYRYLDGAFTEVAVQIDEREVLPFSAPLATSDTRQADLDSWSTSFYTGSNTSVGLTFVGDDSNATFDADDELVVMAADFGARAPSGLAPTDVDATTRVELAGSDADDATRSGYLYLYVRDTARAARTAAVELTPVFTGTTGPFTSVFRSNASAAGMGATRGCGDGGGWGVVMPEDTSIRAAGYTRHFSGRWLEDQLVVRNGTTEGPDVLDIHEARPLWAAFTGAEASTSATIDTTSNRTCTRSVTSFSGAPGTIITLRTGPVRAIRSYYGSNSGTINERTHFYYAQREDVSSFIRVHPIPGISDGLDLSTAAMGMTYYNEHNTGGLLIDGHPDAFDRTFARWEMVTGATQNTVLSVHHSARIELGAATASYAPEMFFIDDDGALTCVCSGDQVMIGAHGYRVRMPEDSAHVTGLPNTDPRLPTPGMLTGVRTIYPLVGRTSVAMASTLADEAISLRVSIDGGAPLDPTAVVCGDHVCEHDETNVFCPMDCPTPAGADVCGDHTCGGYEHFVCLDDCVTPHQDYFVCANATCNATYEPCVGDPGCQDGLAAIAACTDTYTTCAASAASAITDPYSTALFHMLATGCGAAMCSTEF